MKGWDSKAVDRANSGQGVAQVQRKAPAPIPVPPGPRTSIVAPVMQEIVFNEVVPGNNGPTGLLRMGWRKRQRLAGQYEWVVAAARLAPMHGPVRLELVRHTIGGQLDFDNLVSTGKLPIDAIVRCGILSDDNPTIIAERSYTQQRAASKAEQRTVIRLIAL